MNRKYAAILGISQEELESNFPERIANFAQLKSSTTPDQLELIQRWYNGYRFTESPISVYNPFLTLMFFENERFDPFWFATGTPSFLIELVQRTGETPQSIEDKTVARLDLDNSDIDKLSLVAVLYQAGYLTVVDFNEELNVYRLGYPNLEVKLSFTSVLLTYFSEVAQTTKTSLERNIVDYLGR